MTFQIIKTIILNEIKKQENSLISHEEIQESTTLLKALRFLRTHFENVEGRLIGFSNKDGQDSQTTIFDENSYMKILNILVKESHSKLPIFDFSIHKKEEKYQDSIAENTYLGTKFICSKFTQTPGVVSYFIFDGEELVKVKTEDYIKYQNEILNLSDNRNFSIMRNNIRAHVSVVLQKELIALSKRVISQEKKFIKKHSSFKISKIVGQNLDRILRKLITERVSMSGLNSLLEFSSDKKPIFSYIFQNRIYYEMGEINGYIKFTGFDLQTGELFTNFQPILNIPIELNEEFPEPTMAIPKN